MPPLRPLVTIEDSLLDAMIADPAVVAALPGCLVALRDAPTSKCGSCGGRPRRDRAAYAAAKACLARLDDPGRNALKGALRAAQVRIVVAEASGTAAYRF